MKPTKLLPAEQHVEIYFHSPEMDVPFSALLEPSYWMHVSRQLRMGTRIEVVAADGSYWAMLFVRASGRNEAFVEPLQHIELGGPVSPTVEESEYAVTWRGPTHRFGVIRKADKSVVKEDFQLKEHAQLWLKNHMRSIAA